MTTERRAAFDFLDLEILDQTRGRRPPLDESSVSITMPLPFARIARECIREVMGKGEGRGNADLTDSDKLKRNNIYYFAKRTYQELRARRVSVADAKAQAIAAARQYGIDHYGIDLSANRIERYMYSAESRPRVLANPPRRA